MRRLGPYELIRRLDAGTLAERWTAQRSGPGGAGQLFTLELLAARALALPDVRQQLFEEVRRATLISHPNIVSTFELVELEGRWVLVREHVEGVTLAEFGGRARASGQRLPYELVAFILGELLRALDYAHELRPEGQPAPLVHGALMPRDVLLSAAGEVKLSGFGLARIGAELDGGAAVVRYMPPEQLAGSRGPSVDLFALGGILHELLDGYEFRIQATDEAHLLAVARDGQSAPLSPQPHDYPIPLETLRSALLVPRFDQRIPSARAAMQVLMQWPGYHQSRGLLSRMVSECRPPAGPPAAAPDEQDEQDEQDDADSFPPVEARPAQDEDSNLPTILMFSGIGLAVLALLLVGLGFLLGWWEPEPEPEPELATRVEQPAAPDQAKRPGAELTPEVEEHAPVVVEALDGPLPGAELTPEVEPARPPRGSPTGDSGSGSGSATDSSARRRKPSTVNVILTERHYDRLQVKVDGRVFEFDGTKAVELSPGPHVLKLRERSDQPWQSAGKIKLQAGKRYTITLLKPPFAKVELR